MKTALALSPIRKRAEEGTISNHFSDSYINENYGWGNGYVVIPKGHFLHGVDYHEIHNRFEIEVHWGLTFSEELTQGFFERNILEGVIESDVGSWVVGFDTAHAYDSLEKWPKEAVQAEADNLLLQLKGLKDGPSNETL